MFYDYVLISSFMLSSILMALTAFSYLVIKKNISAKTKQYQTLQKKIKTYLNILYFFLLSIFLTRLIFIVAFPLQLEHWAIASNGHSPAILYMLYQALAALLYLLFVFLLQLNHHIKLTHKYDYLLKVLKFSLYFLGIDLLLSVAGWFWYNLDLLVPSVLLKSTGLKPVSGAVSAGLITGLSLFMLLFILLQRKRKPLLRLLFVVVMLVTTVTALYISILNTGFYWPAGNTLALFTYKKAIYGWLWYFIALSALGSQLVAGLMQRLNDQFINRYFAINYTLQLNRIALMAVLGLSVNALLPQIILWII